MKYLSKIFFILFLFARTNTFSQTKIKTDLVILDTIQKPMNPLAPAKAAFYSAIVPGLGQAYNKKYWKIPIVYGALGTSIYFYLSNDKKYNDYRNTYKRRLEGFTDDDFRFLDNDRLIQGQRFYQRNRDLSALITVAFYVLNIVDANVDAHLINYNVNDKLTLSPKIYQSDFNSAPNIGIGLNYQFK